MIWLILLLSTVLRMIHLDQSFWLDEAIGAIAARDYSYFGIISDFIRADNHPPLFYLLLKFWSALFGFSEIALRSMSVLWGVLTVYVFYLIAKKIFKSQFFVLMSTLILATSPLHVYYSQEVRMYPLITFLAVMIIFVYLNLIEKPAKKSWWLFFSILIVIGAASDYIILFLFPVFFAEALINKRGFKWLRSLLLAFIPLLIIFILWLPQFNIQSAGGKFILQILPGWKTVAGGANFKEVVLVWTKFVLGRISLDNKSLYYGLIALSSVPFVVGLFLALKNWRKNYLVWLWLVLPLVLGFLISFIIPAFSYFRFLYVLPAFYLIILLGFESLKNKFYTNFLITFLIIVNILGLGIYYFDKQQSREDWKGAVSFIENENPPAQLAVFEFNEPFAPYRFYSKGIVKGFGAADSVSVDKAKTELKMETLKDVNNLYYFEYLRDLSDPNRVVEGKLASLGFKKIKAYSQFVHVGEISYWKK